MSTVQDEDLIHLARNNKSIKNINIAYCKSITSKGINALSLNLQGLEVREEIAIELLVYQSVYFHPNIHSNQAVHNIFACALASFCVCVLSCTMHHKHVFERDQY